MPGGPTITVLVDAFPEISETFVAAEVAMLARLGADVAVVAHDHARAPDPDVRDAVAATFLADSTSRQRAAALAWLAARHPLRTLADLAARRRWRRAEAPLPLRAIAPLARDAARRGGHLHVHFAAGAALTTLRVARLTGLPYSVTLHGYDIFLRDMNRAEKLAGAVFATSGSDYTVGEVRRMHPEAADRLHRIVMGVDAEAWRRTAPEREDGLVVAVGRLVDKKGFAHLLDAAAALRDRGVAPLRIVIVGEGPLRADLEAQRDALGLTGVVELPGARPSRQVRALVQRAAVVAIPAVIAPSGDRDSMPVIAKEALALEVPVVASDVAGLPEVVRPPWGALVPPGDADALADALAEALALDAERRAARGAAGRAYVATACSVEAETRRMLDLVVAPRP